MSVYSVTGKGWRYDFTRNGTRYTAAWFPTKRQAQAAEARKREELSNSQPFPATTTPTDIIFLELINRRLDYVKAYKSKRYYDDYVWLPRRLVREWPGLRCQDLTPAMVQAYLIERQRVSPLAANKDLRYLRALGNFGVKHQLMQHNPTAGLEFLPVEKRVKYIPSKEDVAKVPLAAPSEIQDYLVAIKETMARMGEINRLTWEEVNFEGRYVVSTPGKRKVGISPPARSP